MKTLFLTTAAMMLGVTAASAADWYVVQDTTTKRCNVMEQKPSAPSETVLNNGQAYSSQSSAQDAMKSMSNCAQSTAQTSAPPPNMANAPASTGTIAQAGNVRVMTQAPADSYTITDYYKQSVYDGQNNKVGSIEDVLVNKSGQVDAFVIGVGGFLGVGEKHVMVPFRAVKVAKETNASSNSSSSWKLSIDASKDELKAAPNFKYDKSSTTWMINNKT
jgi:sporulation protein YlmC with PRC-barrel domain